VKIRSRGGRQKNRGSTSVRKRDIYPLLHQSVYRLGSGLDGREMVFRIPDGESKIFTLPKFWRQAVLPTCPPNQWVPGWK